MIRPAAHSHLIPGPASLDRSWAVGELCRDSAEGGESVRLRVSGDCMEPLISDGDEVVVDSSARLLPGDVIAVVGFDNLIRVHRLLGVVPILGGGTSPKLRWITRADAARWIDSPTDRSRVLGKVRGTSLWRRVTCTFELASVLVGALSRRLTQGGEWR